MLATKDSTADRIRTVTRQQATAERLVYRELLSYFTDQASRVAGAAEDAGVLSAADVVQIFRPDDEHELLMKKTVKPVLLKVIDVAAMAEMKHLSSEKAYDLWGKKATLDLNGVEFEFASELPPQFADAIKNALDELTKQKYWRDIQSTTETNIRSVIEKGLSEGFTEQSLAKQIRQSMNGISKARSLAIARTETTAAMGEGHLLTMENIGPGEEGEPQLTGKRWLAILDNDVRRDHSKLNEVVVPVKATFDVGGWPARYPADYQLPAEQRIRCRCVIISEILIPTSTPS